MLGYLQDRGFEVFDLANGGQFVREVTFEDYDGWVHGIDALPDGSLLILERNEAIARFDAVTGDRISRAALDWVDTESYYGSVEGLTCFGN